MHNTSCFVLSAWTEDSQRGLSRLESHNSAVQVLDVSKSSLVSDGRIIFGGISKRHLMH